MAGRNQAVLVLATFAAIVGLCSAATFTVGDKTGWVIPPSANFYTNWASKHTFKVGDVLVFNFPAGAHTVAEVTKAAYDACNLNNPIVPAITTSPAKMTITSPGTKYYLCTIPGHCAAGQKLSIVATGAAPSTAPATAPATAPTPSKAAPTAPKAAPTTPTSSPTTAPATSPSGSDVPAVPATSGPSAGAAAPPSENSFAAPAAAGFSLMSLVAIAAAALFV